MLKSFKEDFGRLVCWLVLLSFVLQTGCTHKSPILPEAERQKLGSIGLVAASYCPEFELQTPAKGGWAGFGRGLARGSATGFSAPLGSGVNTGGGDYGGIAGLFILGVAVICGTVGGVVGGIKGAVKALPAAEVEAAEAALEKARIEQQNAQEKLRDRVLQLAKQWPQYSITPLSEQGPKVPDGKETYTFLSAKGLDTVLEIGVRNFGLAGEWEVNPLLQFFMNSDVRLVRVKDGTEFYQYTFKYVSDTHSFSDWAKDNSRLFYESMDNALDALSSQIVNNLFVSSSLEPKSKTAPNPGPPQEKDETSHELEEDEGREKSPMPFTTTEPLQGIKELEAE